MAHSPLRLAIAGAAGRMGRCLIEMCSESPDLELGVALERVGSEILGRDAGEVAGVGKTGVSITSALADHTGAFEVLVDFTTPEATLSHVQSCRSAGRRMVIGTTGLDAVQREQIVEAGRDIAIVMAPNMSVGVNLCFKLAELAAGALGEGFDVEILEAHHNRKKDAPSGTALRLGEIVAGALGQDLDECAVYTRKGETGPRDPGTIGFQSIRAGDIVGEHTVFFAGEGERVEITHRALSRRTFAAGALRAARWVMERKRGLYDMQDVLGLR